MRTLFLLLIGLMPLISCDKSKYHSNEIDLIQNKELNIIELNFEKNESDFESELLKNIGVDSICNGSEMVSLPLDLEDNLFLKTSNSVNVPVIFYNDCRAKNGLIICGIKYNFDLNINEQEQLLVNGEVVNIQQDSIINQLKSVWHSKEMRLENLSSSKFRLISSANFETNRNQSIKVIFKSFIEFYLKKVNQFCEVNYQKSIPELNELEVREVKEKFPFVVHLSYVKNLPSFFSFPPPPPPKVFEN